MKNQYFGDKRDFFKYDLLLELAEGLSFIQRLTFIPLLTPADTSGDGKLDRYEPGARRQDLHRFLQACLGDGRKDIRELRSFFQGRGFEYSPYRDDTFFSHDARAAYFRNVPEASLRSAVVFLDPDNGLEVSSLSRSNGAKFVLYSELTGLLRRMDDASVLMVYQHLPRVQREVYFERQGQELRALLEVNDMTCLSDNQIAFFVAAKGAERAGEVRSLLQEYAARTGLLFPL